MKRPLVVIALSATILVANPDDQAPADHHHPHSEEPEAPTGQLRMRKAEAAVTTSAISVALNGQSMTAYAGSMEILKVQTA